MLYFVLVSNALVNRLRVCVSVGGYFLKESEPTVQTVWQAKTESRKYTKERSLITAHALWTNGSFVCLSVNSPIFDCFWFLCTQRRGRCYGPIRTNVIPRERPDTMLILILLGCPLSPPNIMYSILYSLASQVTFHLLYGQSIVHLFRHAAALASDDIVGKSRHLFL